MRLQTLKGRSWGHDPAQACVVIRSGAEGTRDMRLAAMLAARASNFPCNHVASWSECYPSCDRCQTFRLADAGPFKGSVVHGARVLNQLSPTEGSVAAALVVRPTSPHDRSATNSPGAPALASAAQPDTPWTLTECV